MNEKLEQLYQEYLSLYNKAQTNEERKQIRSDYEKAISNVSTLTEREAAQLQRQKREINQYKDEIMHLSDPVKYANTKIIRNNKTPHLYPKWQNERKKLIDENEPKILEIEGRSKPDPKQIEEYIKKLPNEDGNQPIENPLLQKVIKEKIIPMMEKETEKVNKVNSENALGRKNIHENNKIIDAEVERRRALRAIGILGIMPEQEKQTDTNYAIKNAKDEFERDAERKSNAELELRGVANRLQNDTKKNILGGLKEFKNKEQERRAKKTAETSIQDFANKAHDSNIKDAVRSLKEFKNQELERRKNNRLRDALEKLKKSENVKDSDAVLSSPFTSQEQERFDKITREVGISDSNEAKKLRDLFAQYQEQDRAEKSATQAKADLKKKGELEKIVQALPSVMPSEGGGKSGLADILDTAKNDTKTQGLRRALEKTGVNTVEEWARLKNLISEDNLVALIAKYYQDVLQTPTPEREFAPDNSFLKYAHQQIAKNAYENKDIRKKNLEEKKNLFGSLVKQDRLNELQKKAYHPKALSKYMNNIEDRTQNEMVLEEIREKNRAALSPLVAEFSGFGTKNNQMAHAGHMYRMANIKSIADQMSNRDYIRYLNKERGENKRIAQHQIDRDREDIDKMINRKESHIDNLQNTERENQEALLRDNRHLSELGNYEQQKAQKILDEKRTHEILEAAKPGIAITELKAFTNPTIPPKHISDLTKLHINPQSAVEIPRFESPLSVASGVLAGVNNMGMQGNPAQRQHGFIQQQRRKSGGIVKYASGGSPVGTPDEYKLSSYGLGQAISRSQREQYDEPSFWDKAENVGRSLTEVLNAYALNGREGINEMLARKQAEKLAQAAAERKIAEEKRKEAKEEREWKLKLKEHEEKKEARLSKDSYTKEYQRERLNKMDLAQRYKEMKHKEKENQLSAEESALLKELNKAALKDKNYLTNLFSSAQSDAIEALQHINNGMLPSEAILKAKGLHSKTIKGKPVEKTRVNMLKMAADQ